MCVCIFDRRLWITCVAFGVIGIGAALSVTPIYADILNIGKYGDSNLKQAMPDNMCIS